MVISESKRHIPLDKHSHIKLNVSILMACALVSQFRPIARPLFMLVTGRCKLGHCSTLTALDQELTIEDDISLFRQRCCLQNQVI